MKKQLIMMIEDEANVLSMNKEYLESLGYEICSAVSLKNAEFLLGEYAPDLILLDVMLPDGSGLDFCAKIREMTNVPIIFLTSRNETDSMVKGLLEGGDDYITKPYNMNVLGARIAAQLRRAGIVNETLIDMHPLFIDTVSGIAKIHDETIPFTKKEVQLLICFARYHGQRQTYEELFSRAWGEQYDKLSQTLPVHIANLRKKLNSYAEGWFEIKHIGSKEYIFSKIRY